jgi:hypothetical protein
MTKVKIELDRSSDEFLLMCPTEDKEKCTLKIANICIFVPVAQLSEPVYREINSILSGNRKENNSIAIHYRLLHRIIKNIQPIFYKK